MAAGAKRVAIATLLAQEPQLYLLDEPIAYLDLKHQIAMLDIERLQCLFVGQPVIGRDVRGDQRIGQRIGRC